MKKQSDLSRLLAYAGSFKYLTVSSWFLSAVSAVLALVPFVYIWKILEEILKVAPNYGAAENLAYYGWKAVLYAVISMLVYISALMCSHIGAFRVATNIRISAMHHIVKLPMGFMDEFGSGKLRKIVNESSAATETFLAHQLPDRAGAVTTPFAMLVMLAVFDWRLGLLSLVPVVIAFAIMATLTGKRMVRKMKEYQDALALMSNEAVEYVRGIPVVKTFGQSVFSFKKFKASIDNYEKWVVAYTKEMRMSMMFYTTIINSVFAVLIGAAIVITRSGVTDTFLLNLFFYIIFTPIITVTLMKIMFSSENAMIVSDALKRIDSVMSLKPMPQTAHPRFPKDNSITLDHVSFCYQGASINALDDISLHIKAGERIAFVGPSGGGKTTLASAIARFWDVAGGHITIGGVNVKDISKEDLMNTVSFVFQDSKLLKTSVYENVRMAKPEADRAEILKAHKSARCDDIIAKLPLGVDTVIGTKGVYLSGGEQQRIAIARVILKNTPIIILDEATAYADPDNEYKVQAAFTELFKGKTVIMIAHRLSTVSGADRIIVLKDGKITESGNHEALIRENGLYLRMWNEYNRAAKWKVGVKE